MRFLVLALLFALVAVVCAIPFRGAVQDLEQPSGGKGKGKGKGGNMLGKLCSMPDDEIAKAEPKFAKMRAFGDCMVANGVTFMRDCQNSAYGSELSSFKDMKASMCPPDATKQAAFKACLSKGKPDKDAMKKARAACKVKASDPPPGMAALPMPGTPEESSAL
ncbi:hypothetical protein PILCRDRAFT_821738 [Piloderma croceum F 1598]|uniref:Secreted protein n=1 Tax=Piloderma croceum (strain F 1598) TaxID=765440 RepID=A0A0C3B4X8_PILCF|nr:hypothetical protein PILCRDRAFT_821738 [Piloderma croceum F 1598]